MTAAIVGVAESDLGVTGKSRFALQAEAVVAALADAGLPHDPRNLVGDLEQARTSGGHRQLGDHARSIRPARARRPGRAARGGLRPIEVVPRIETGMRTRGGGAPPAAAAAVGRGMFPAWRGRLE